MNLCKFSYLVFFNFLVIFLGYLNCSAQSWVSGTNEGDLVYTGGNVGVGMSNPYRKLQVAGRIFFSDGSAPISEEYESFTGHIIQTIFSNNLIYGYTKGTQIKNILSAEVQVGDDQNARYFYGMEFMNYNHGTVYGVSIANNARNYITGNVYGTNSMGIGMRGEVLMDETGYVEGDIIGVHGIVNAKGMVTGQRWAGFFSGNSYMKDSLGIGTKDLSAVLCVAGNASFEDEVLIQGDDARLVIGDDLVAEFKSDESTINSQLIINNNLFARERLYVGTSSFESSISNSSDPDYYGLYVEKGIRSEKIKVDVKENWPDYVFYPAYNLRSLEETSLYIGEHKHLPEMPSAREIEQNGLDLASINLKLLEKIEELTLYLIEQNRKLMETQKEVDILKSEITSLKEK